MTKLERLKQEKANIENLFSDALESDHKGKALAKLYTTAKRLVNEMIYEQERSIESGAKGKDKNFFAILNLAEKHFCNAIKIDPAFRVSDYDPWEITMTATIEEAKAIGIKDKRTVLKILSDPLYRRHIEREGCHWDDIQAWKSIFQPFLDNKNYRLPEREQKELVELRSRMDLPWDTLYKMFIKNEEKLELSREDRWKELKELRSRLEPYQGQ